MARKQKQRKKQAVLAGKGNKEGSDPTRVSKSEEKMQKPRLTLGNFDPLSAADSINEEHTTNVTGNQDVEIESLKTEKPEPVNTSLEPIDDIKRDERNDSGSRILNDKEQTIVDRFTSLSIEEEKESQPDPSILTPMTPIHKAERTRKDLTEMSALTDDHLTTTLLPPPSSPPPAVVVPDQLMTGMQLWKKLRQKEPDYSGSKYLPVSLLEFEKVEQLLFKEGMTKKEKVTVFATAIFGRCSRIWNSQVDELFKSMEHIMNLRNATVLQFFPRAKDSSFRRWELMSRLRDRLEGMVNAVMSHRSKVPKVALRAVKPWKHVAAHRKEQDSNDAIRDINLMVSTPRMDLSKKENTKVWRRKKNNNTKMSTNKGKWSKKAKMDKKSKNVPMKNVPMKDKSKANTNGRKIKEQADKELEDVPSLEVAV